MHIVSDGTTANTQILDDAGNQLRNVTDIRLFLGLQGCRVELVLSKIDFDLDIPKENIHIYLYNKDYTITGAS